MLKNIKASGIKGREFDHDLGPVTVITGKPFSGKTARKDAITFFLLSYLPSLGKLVSKTAQLASSVEMHVAGVATRFNGWRHITISKGKASLTSSDGMPVIPPLLLDPTEYFSMGPTERVKFVFSKVTMDAERFSITAIIEEIRALKLAEENEHTRAALQQIVEGIQEEDTSGTIQDWISRVIDMLKIELKTNKDAAKRYTGSSQTAEEMAVVHGGAESRPSDTILAEIAEVEQVIGRCNGAARGAQTAIAKHNTWKNEKARLEAIIAADTDRTDELANLNANKDRMQTAANAYVTHTAEIQRAKNDAHMEVVRLETTLGQAEALAANPINPKINEIMRRITGLVSAGMEMGKSLEKLRKTYDDNVKKGCCPFCGTLGDDFTAKLKVKFDAEAKIIVDNVKEKTEEVAECERLVATEKAGVLMVAQTQIEETKTLLAIKRAKYDGLAEDLRKSEADDLEFLRLKQELDAILRKIVQIGASQKAIVAAREAIIALGPEDMSPSADLFDEAKEELAEATTKHTALKEELQALGAAHAAEQQRAQTLLHRARVSAAVEVYTLAVKTMGEIQERAIEASVGPVVDRANLFCRDILKSPLLFKDGEFGRVDGPNWISHATFSGTEQLLAFAGISVALTAESPLKIVMMDELGRMDAPTKESVVRRMLNLVATGEIDQFVGIDVSPDPYDQIPGVTVIKL